MSNLLSKILAPGALSTAFQPIFEMDNVAWVPVMLECLSRGPVLTNAAHAGVLFEYAQLKGAEYLVDRACITAALNALPDIARPRRFSFNVFAATLARDAGFTQWIAAAMHRIDLKPSAVVFEIVEHGEAWDTDLFLASLRNLRALGAAIALDDVGLAHSNFRRIIESHAEFLKLDQCIIRNCHQDTRRQALLRSLAQLAQDLGTSLVAEGVETEAELDIVRRYGIGLVQGFLFSKPMTAAGISGLPSRLSLNTRQPVAANIPLSAKYRKPPKSHPAYPQGTVWHGK